MKTYYIYHINGVKIGCTSDLNKRMRDQGFTDWDILEEHTDIYEASDRELELQEEYSLPLDKIPYWKSVENRPVWNNETRHVFSKSDLSKGGNANKGIPKTYRKLTLEEAKEIRLKAKPYIYTYSMLAEEYNTTAAIIKAVVTKTCYNT